MTQIPSILELAGLCWSDCMGPDWVTVIPRKPGCTLIWDAICTDIFSALHLTQVTREASWLQRQLNRRRRQFTLTWPRHTTLLQWLWRQREPWSSLQTLAAESEFKLHFCCTVGLSGLAIRQHGCFCGTMDWSS